MCQQTQQKVKREKKLFLLCCWPLIAVKHMRFAVAYALWNVFLVAQQLNSTQYNALMSFYNVTGARGFAVVLQFSFYYSARLYEYCSMPTICTKRPVP